MTQNCGLKEFVWSVAVVAAVGVGMDTALADGDKASPFKGSVSGMATFDGVTPRFTGAGQFSQLGQVTNVGSAVLLSQPVPLEECEGGLGIPNVHTEILTASNGDQLALVMNDVACVVGENIFHGTGHWEVFYGTGRFANTKGIGTMEGDVNFNIGFFAFKMAGRLEDIQNDD